MELSASILTEHDCSAVTDSQRIHRRPPINVFTGFRALACLWVFAYHRSMHSADEFKTLHLEWIALTGAAGVPLFFCLSGFIMIWVYIDCAFKSSTCYWSFVGRRAARLFPLYYLSLIISIYDVRCTWSVDKPCTLLNWTHIVLTLLGIRTWIPYNFTDLGWNPVIWSIQTEFFFYVTFPFSLRFIRYLLKTNRISLLVDEFYYKNAIKRLYLLWFLVLCICTVPLAIRLLMHDDLTISLVFQRGEIICYSPFTRLPEFILGMITGIIFILKSASRNPSNVDATTNLIPNDDQKQHNRFGSSLGNYFSNYKWQYLVLDVYFVCQILFFIIIPSPVILNKKPITKYDEILVYGPLISLIMCIDLYLYARYPSSLTSKLLTTSLLIDMGNISYAFYCFVDALPHLVLLVSDVVENSAIMMLWAGIGLAVFAHHYIEVPVYNWANKKLPKCQCT